MQVIVKLFAMLRRFTPANVTPGEPFTLMLPEGATLADVLAQLGIPEDEAKVMFVNGRAHALDYALQDADDTGIFPPVGGG